MNTTLVAHVDTPGGGQVWIDGTTMYVGHMSAPNGTSIFDVSDPKKPRALAAIDDMPEGWHSHKVRAANGTMVVNYERLGKDGDPEFGGGLGIYDVTNPAKPVLRTHWLSRAELAEVRTLSDTDRGAGGYGSNASRTTFAGPPFQTDDPDPVDYHHFDGFEHLSRIGRQKKVKRLGSGNKNVGGITRESGSLRLGGVAGTDRN